MLVDKARVLYYGPPGSGKTTNAGHLALLGKVPWFLAEPGLKAVQMRRRGIDPNNFLPKNTVDAEYLMESYWQIKARLDSDPDAYVGGVVDTVSALIKKEVAGIRKREYEKAVEAAAAAGEEYEGPRRHKAGGGVWEVYGEVTEVIREVIEHYVDLPMHLAWTAHVRRDEDEDSGAVQYGPAASPSLQQDLVAYFDCIIRTQRKVVGGKPFFIGHTVASGPNGCYEGKDRLDVLPLPIMNLPTMTRIIDYMNGDLDPDNDPIQQEWVDAITENPITEEEE